MRLTQIAILIIIGVFFSFNVKAQKSSYIIENGVYSMVYEVANQSNKRNAVECMFKRTKKGEYITAGPDEVQEYGVSNGPVYEALRVKIDGKERYIYLKRLTHKRIKIYQHEEKGQSYFFIHYDGKLTALSKQPYTTNYYKTVMEDICEAEGRDMDLWEFRYSDVSLKMWYNQIMKDQIVLKQNMKKGLRKGLIVGVGNTNWDLPFKDQETYDTDNKTSYLIGGWIELPLFSDPRFCFASGLKYSWGNIEGEGKRSLEGGISYSYYTCKSSGLEVPLMLRIRPEWFWGKVYLSVGVECNYLRLASFESYEVKVTDNTNQVNINGDIYDSFSVFKPVLALGVGYNADISDKLGVRLGVNYHQLRGKDDQLESKFEMSKIMFTLGIELF
ncbi:PorT family protein [Puteibacter caeruleilacunae]|nr:PorT family protein [Puteibacter caeruleilacunae]